MSVLDIIDIIGLLFPLVIAIWGTAYAYEIAGEKILGRIQWQPSFKRPLRWIGPLLVLLCVGSIIFVLR